MKTKILLDTDIGSDIDDAVCLAYLLAQPKCELMGVTTVSGEADKRAMMADVLCKVAGKDIPIFAGLENPLVIPIRQTKASQYEAAAKWPHRRDFPQGGAIDFLRETIRKHPHEITLLTIGPLTNIGTLLTVDPKIAPLLKSLVMMGGNFTPVRLKDGSSCYAEWNILNDPHAAAIVFRAAIPEIRAIGLDVTLQVTMPSGEVREKFQKKLLKPVLDFAEVWFSHAGGVITFHDPLAATTIFDEGICEFKRGNVEVELIGEKLAGFTFWNPDEKSGRHWAAETVDGKRFFGHYFGVFE